MVKRREVFVFYSLFLPTVMWGLCISAYACQSSYEASYYLTQIPKETALPFRVASIIMEEKWGRTGPCRRAGIAGRGAK